MNYLEELLHNTILINAVTGWLCAQILKTITHLIINKKFVWERLVGDGGMPSAHSATVCALAGTTFLHCGPASPEFAIAAIFAIIVMHDAMGVRFETGKQAKILNEMMDIFKSMGNSTLTAEEKLKEFVGHTKLQVAMGALLGIVIAVILGLLYYFGKKAQTKQAAQQEQMEAMKQTVSMLIIDKKKLRMKDSGLPQMVIDQTPKMMRRAKLPIVKAKVGPRIMTLICDAAIFDQIPVKKEVKATVSGIYITGVRGIRGSLEQPEKKNGFWQKMLRKARGEEK